MNKDQEIALKQQLLALAQKSQFDQAEVLARRLLVDLPQDAEVWYAYAQITMAMGRFEVSAHAYLKAAQKPTRLRAAALDAATDMCQRIGLFELGYQAAQYLLPVGQDKALAHFKLGYFASKLLRETEALDHLSRAVDLKPDNIGYLMQKANALVHIGCVEQARQDYLRADALDPQKNEAYGQYLYISNYLENLSEQSLYEAHLVLAQRLENRFEEASLKVNGLDSRRLKLAYLSKDFCSHAVASFFIPLLAAHNVSRVEIFCYSDVSRPDEISHRIKSKAENWLDCAQLSDLQLCEQIKRDEVDVLVDLCGYAGGKRMGVFAMRAAPVQVNYLGYPNTSGLSRMDYRVTDRICDPEGLSEQYYSEQLVRLEPGFLCYRPLDEQLPESRPPCIENKYLTFGSFNVFPKVRGCMVEAWAKILKAVPESRLYLKSKLFSEESWRKETLDRFIALGVGKEQLLFKGRSKTYQEHLREYGEIDIHLDAHPYNGTTTTCDALWMGVPTLCVLGESHRSRVSASLMSQVGLGEFVSDSLERYVEKAIAFAKKPDAFVALRQGNRDRLLSSPVGNSRAVAGALEDFCEQVVSGTQVG